MGQVTLLRKLTEKSVFGFGKYNGLTIRQVLDLNHPQYLRWIYFNINEISFVDEILGEIKISENYRIKKPGANKELGEQLDKEIFGRMSPLDKHILKGTIKKQKKRNYINYVKRDNLVFSRDFRTRVNHGHESYSLAKFKTENQ